MEGIFITGTNTGVGKTVVARAIADGIARRGIRVAAIKPVESGVDKVPEDAAALSCAAQMTVPPGENCRYAFKDPVSPHLAAEREGRQIALPELVSFVRNWSNSCDYLVVEGAGGLLVPLSFEHTYADLIAALELKLVIVAPNILGTINATLLTIEAARSRQIDIAGVVLNGTPECDFGNGPAISTLGRVPILGAFPTTDISDDEKLSELLWRVIDMSALSF